MHFGRLWIIAIGVVALIAGAVACRNEGADDRQRTVESCPSDATMVRILFAVDDGHRDAVLVLPVWSFEDDVDVPDMYSGDTDLFLDLRGADGSVIRSIKAAPKGLAFVDVPTASYDPTDTVNMQDITFRFRPEYRTLEFASRAAAGSSPLQVYLLKEGADINGLHGGIVTGADIGIPLGTRIDLREAVCDAASPGGPTAILER